MIRGVFGRNFHRAIEWRRIAGELFRGTGTECQRCRALIDQLATLCRVFLRKQAGVRDVMKSMSRDIFPVGEGELNGSTLV